MLSFALRAAAVACVYTFFASRLVSSFNPAVPSRTPPAKIAAIRPFVMCYIPPRLNNYLCVAPVIMASAMQTSAAHAQNLCCFILNSSKASIL